MILIIKKEFYNSFKYNIILNICLEIHEFGKKSFLGYGGYGVENELYCSNQEREILFD